MPKQIRITAGRVQVEAELNDGPTAKAVAEAPGIKAKVRRWGGEIYFSIPVAVELASDVVSKAPTTPATTFAVLATPLNLDKP